MDLSDFDNILPGTYEFDIDITGFNCLAELSGLDPPPEKWVCPFKSDDAPGSGCGSEHPDTCPLMKQQAEFKAKVAPSTWSKQ